MVEGRVILHPGIGSQLKSVPPTFPNIIRRQLHILENNTTNSLPVSVSEEDARTFLLLISGGCKFVYGCA